jgi:hypothetical protein
MIDTDKYTGHTEGPWNLTPEGHIVADDMTVVCNKHTKRIVETNHKDTQLMADAPLLLAEVKQLREWKRVWFAEVKRLREQVRLAKEWVAKEYPCCLNTMDIFTEYIGEEE